MIFRDIISKEIIIINRLDNKDDKLYMSKILKLYNISFLSKKIEYTKDNIKE